MGDQTVLHKLFSAHARQLRGFFRRRILERDDARDLSQEVFVRLLRLQDLSSIEDPQRYLFTVAGNLLRERAVAQGRHERPVRVPIEEVLEAPELPVELPAEQEIDAQKQVACLRAALQALSARDREVLAMVYEQKLSYREIGRRLGITKSAVEKSVTRATLHCRKQMDAMGAL